MRALVLCCVLLASEAHAASLYVSPSGSGDCSAEAPCSSIQKAVDNCPNGGACNIALAAGKYSQRVNVIYYKAISIRGPSTCDDRRAVLVESPGTAGAVFDVQDHAILTLSCLTIRGPLALSARQFAIVDINAVHFDGASLVRANELAKVNIDRPSGELQTSASDGGILTLDGVSSFGKDDQLRAAFNRETKGRKADRRNFIIALAVMAILTGFGFWRLSRRIS